MMLHLTDRTWTISNITIRLDIHFYYKISPVLFTAMMNEWVNHSQS